MQILKHFKDGVSSALKNLRKKTEGLTKNNTSSILILFL